MEETVHPSFKLAAKSVIFVIDAFPPPGILTQVQIGQLMRANCKSLGLARISGELEQYVYEKYLVHVTEKGLTATVPTLKLISDPDPEAPE